MKIKLYDIAVNTQDPNFHSRPRESSKEQVGRKVKILEDVLKLIPNQCKNGAGIKAILTAPEYFFARSADASNRHYTEQDKDDILQKLKELSDANPGVLIVPGTIAWRQPAIEGSRKMKEQTFYQYNENIGKSVTQNDWLNYYRQFEDTRLMVARDIMERAHRICYDNSSYYYNNIAKENKMNELKRASNGLELAYNSAYFYLGGKQRYQYDKVAGFMETSLTTSNVFIRGRFDPIIEIEGIKFGIEICYDHGSYILRDFVSETRHLAEPRWATPIDIHLILSACVGNQYSLARPGGNLIHSSSAPFGYELQQLHFQWPLSPKPNTLYLYTKNLGEFLQYAAVGQGSITEGFLNSPQGLYNQGSSVQTFRNIKRKVCNGEELTFAEIAHIFSETSSRGHTPPQCRVYLDGNGKRIASTLQHVNEVGVNKVELDIITRDIMTRRMGYNEQTIVHAMDPSSFLCSNSTRTGTGNRGQRSSRLDEDVAVRSIVPRGSFVDRENSRRGVNQNPRERGCHK